MLSWISIVGYRSVLSAELQLAPVTVILGGNGTGKSNLYRSLLILGAAASGRLAAEFAQEGGFHSALWAGPRQRGGVRMRFTAEWDDLKYQLELGVPTPPTPFPLDPQVKSEEISVPSGPTLAQRGSGSAFVRDEDGNKQVYPFTLWGSESMLSQIVDPRRLPILSDIRERILGWRTYHHFRTDSDAPVRRPRTGFYTPVLCPSGDDLAAALHTVNEIGRGGELAAAIDSAFPGCRLAVEIDERGQFVLTMTRRGLQRPLTAAELSDGTLRYLALAVALFSPRPPELMAINEPETSLHPDLLAPLAELMLSASRTCQLWVTTHSETLAQALTGHPRALLHQIDLREGQTKVRGAHPLGLRP